MTFIPTLFLTFLFLCWGSFLNGVAYRLLHRKKFLAKRSYCPQCKHTLAWYDLIPVFSFIFLRGHCRYCTKKISWLYPLTEIITTITMLLLWFHVPADYFGAYFILFSGLIVSVRTDLEKMVFLRIITLGLIPVGLICSTFSLIPITPTQSMAGTLFGYGLLWAINKLFFLIRKKPGMGSGDFELLAAIGSFIGISGCWLTLMIASWTASLYAVIIALSMRKIPKGTIKMPFGPFLALGTLITILYSQELLRILF